MGLVAILRFFGSKSGFELHTAFWGWLQRVERVTGGMNSATLERPDESGRVPVVGWNWWVRLIAFVGSVGEAVLWGMGLVGEGLTEEARKLAGGRLRRTRIQQGLSIRHIAELAGISKTTILQVESGRTSRRSTYLKVAAVMGLHLDRLILPHESDDQRYAVHRLSDDSWFDLTSFDSGPLDESAQRDPRVRKELSKTTGVAPLNILACRLEQGRIKPTILDLYAPSAPRAHVGEEHVFVLTGQAVVSVGASEVLLNEGESITFWSSEPHCYAPGPGSPLPVRLLSVRVDA